jgi:hypothetical protein
LNRDQQQILHDHLDLSLFHLSHKSIIAIAPYAGFVSFLPQFSNLLPMRYLFPHIQPVSMHQLTNDEHHDTSSVVALRVVVA